MAGGRSPSVLRTAMVTGGHARIGLADCARLSLPRGTGSPGGQGRGRRARGGNQAALGSVLALVPDLVDPDAGGISMGCAQTLGSRVTILGNNAGIPSPRRDGRTAGLLEMTVEEWHAVLEVISPRRFACAARSSRSCASRALGTHRLRVLARRALADLHFPA